MNTEINTEDFLHKEITDKIIACFYKVYNKLGFGFLEKVYERAMLIELRRLGLKAEEQRLVKVFYDEFVVGEFTADILVEGKVFVENKALKKLCEENENQLINYLKSTEIEVGLLLNFGPKPEIKRKIFTNDRKPHLKLSNRINL